LRFAADSAGLSVINPSFGELARVHAACLSTCRDKMKQTAIGGGVDVRKRAAARTLFPKEHGAYGQIALPLVAALAGARPSVVAYSIGAAGFLAFLAHEPLLVLAGQRGSRARREDGRRAGRRLLALGGSAALLGTWALLSLPTAVRLLAMIPVVLGAAVGFLIHRRAEKTTGGEMLAAAALSSVGLLAGVAAGTSVEAAVMIWAAWCVAFASMTIAVRTIIASARITISPIRRTLAPLVLASVSIAVAMVGIVPVFIGVAFVPTLLLALALAVRPPSPRQLRKVGWTLVGATSFATVVIAIGSSRNHDASAKFVGRDRAIECWSTSCSG
jgi:hypothetical protein